MATMPLPPVVRKSNIKSATEFCEKLMKNGDPLCIRGTTERFHVRLLKASTHVHVDTLMNQIKAHPEIIIERVDVPSTIRFSIPRNRVWELDKVYVLIFDARP